MWSFQNMLQAAKRSDEHYGYRSSPEEYKAKILEEHRRSLRWCEDFGKDSSLHKVKETVQAPFSHNKLSSLAEVQPISIREIQDWHDRHGDDVFFKRVLLCTTIEWPFRMTSIMTIVEDDEGRAARLSLYNFASSSANPRTVLPKGAMLAILDPYYKRTADGGKSIRMDNPQGIIFFRNNEEFQEFKRKKEIMKPSISDGQSKDCQAKEVKSADTLKAEGNDHFQQDRYEEAIVRYSEALQTNPNEPTKVILYSNRAECFLRVSDFKSALSDSLDALKIDPNHVKSKYRKCKAFVGLRKFAEAAKVIPDYSTNLDLDAPTRIVLARGFLEETEAKFDVFAMIGEEEENPILTGHADYVNPDISIVSLSKSKGRGGVATKPLKFGTIVMACKASAIAFAEPKTIGFRYKSGGKINTETQGEVASSLMREVTGNLEFGKQLYDLYDGPNFSGKNRNFDPASVDVERIKRIVTYNAFSGEPLSSSAKMMSTSLEDAKRTRKNKYEKEYKEKHQIPTGVWLKPSYLNHSCAPNCIWFCVGDYMFVVTNKDIKSGEELTVPYTNTLSTFNARAERFEHYGFKCACERCTFFADKPHLAELEERIEKEFDEVREQVYTHPNSILPTLVNIVNRAQQAFGPGIQYTSCHYMSLTAIVSVLEVEQNHKELLQFSRMVCELTERTIGRGTANWVMAKMHEVTSLLEMQNENFLSVLRDTCQTFTALYHTSPHHFRKAFVDPLIPFQNSGIADLF